MVWPFTRKTVTVETKSLSAPDADLLALFGAAPASGYAASLSTALTVPPVQRAIGLISGSIASFAPVVEHKVGSDWQADDTHPVAKLLATRPNDWSSTFETVRDLVATALTHDKGGLAFVNRIGGEVREIVRYDAPNYAVTYSTDGRQEPSFAINNVAIPSSDVIHLRSPFSKAPLSLAADAIGVAKAMEKHAGNLFTRGARPSGVIESPKVIGESGVTRMQNGWSAAQDGVGNSAKTPVLWDGTTFRPLTFSSVDAQFLELRKEQTVEIARAFGVPPSMLYEMGRATWANAEQAAKEWLASLELWILPLESAMRHALFSQEERPDWRIRFDRDDFSAVDLTARATAIASLIASRTLSPNEGRDWLDMPPRAGGDEYANPNTGSSQPGSAQNPADPPRGSAQPPADSKDAPDAA